MTRKLLKILQKFFFLVCVCVFNFSLYTRFEIDFRSFVVCSPLSFISSFSFDLIKLQLFDVQTNTKEKMQEKRCVPKMRDAPSPIDKEIESKGETWYVFVQNICVKFMVLSPLLQRIVWEKCVRSFFLAETYISSSVFFCFSLARTSFVYSFDIHMVFFFGTISHIIFFLSCGKPFPCLFSHFIFDWYMCKFAFGFFSFAWVTLILFTLTDNKNIGAGHSCNNVKDAFESCSLFSLHSSGYSRRLLKFFFFCTKFRCGYYSGKKVHSYFIWFYSFEQIMTDTLPIHKST